MDALVILEDCQQGSTLLYRSPLLEKVHAKYDERFGLKKRRFTINIG
jgi:hypothetical protein